MGAAPLDTLLGYIRRLGPPEDADSDGELVRRFAADRDEAAFTSLVRRHGPLVWSVCSRLVPHQQDAEDAFQATFLILARKAGSLHNPDALSPFLYGVARRAALKVRQTSARHRSCACLVENLPAPESTDLVWRDLRPLLDEEVGRLPEKYRLPFILCYLEGVTNEEAAKRLRCPKGTILSRLSRARERLRGRLVRRGVELSGAALVTVLTAHASPAAVPPALVTDTIRTGLAFAAGSAGAGSAVALAAGVLQSMFLTKLKMTIAVLLTLCVVGSGASLISRRAGAQGPPSAAPVPKRTAADTTPAKSAPAAEDKNGVALAPARPARGMELARTLAQPVAFQGFDDPKTTLAEALESLGNQYNATFDVNETAFTLAQVPDVLKREIAQPYPIPGMKASLQTVLRKILSRLPPEANPIFVIRKDHIEITTQKAVRDELGIQGRQLLPLVYEEFEDQPLPVILKALANASGLSIVLDSHAAAAVASDKALKISVEFRNVPVDTAVRVLADMADLGMVRLDNVLYVTTRQKAARLQAEPDKDTAKEKAAP